MAVVIETTVGDFTVDLFTEQRPQSKFNLFAIRNDQFSTVNLT